MEPVLLFVYGTLRMGEANHGVLRGAVCVSRKAFVTGKLADTGKGYPALFQLGEGLVAGELYAVNWTEAGAGLDELETYYGPGDPRNEYERIQVTVTDESQGGSRELLAWTYVYPPAAFSRYASIPSGDWTSVSGRRML